MCWQKTIEFCLHAIKQNAISSRLYCKSERRTIPEHKAITKTRMLFLSAFLLRVCFLLCLVCMILLNCTVNTLAVNHPGGMVRFAGCWDLTSHVWSPPSFAFCYSCPLLSPSREDGPLPVPGMTEALRQAHAVWVPARPDPCWQLPSKALGWRRESDSQ